MLSINEIFYSIQGESTFAGKPCVFVRLAGCDLRCSWCDTPHAFTGGRRLAVEDVVDEVRARGVPFVTVTGGEPLLQAACLDLVRQLADGGLEVQVETGGHRDVSGSRTDGRNPATTSEIRPSTGRGRRAVRGRKPDGKDAPAPELRRHRARCANR